MESSRPRLTRGLGTLLAIVVTCLAGNAYARSAATSNFDHFPTGFPLIGSHVKAQCENCHLNGIFKGTPNRCVACHTLASRIPASKKPVNHFRTTDNCADCHNTLTWKIVTRVDHTAVIGTCASCHNGNVAQGRSANHVTSGNTCDDCHTTASWTSVRFDHSSVTGSCFACHNGTTAAGKSNNHITSGNTCDDCHTTNSWPGAVFDHSGVAPSTCTNCHNGSTATGKSQNHIQTSAQCDACHATRAWTPANFDHNNVTGSCSSCHNGSQATGKSSGHFVTSLRCDTCHSTNNWTPLILRHSSPNYPGDHHTNPGCTACHRGNSQTVTWTSPSYQPDCAGCHANDYRQGEHNNRSVSQNRDCAGSGCHSVRDRNWD